MSQPDKNDEVADHAREALRIANNLATAVLRGSPGQQRLALDFARELDQATRGGFFLTKKG